MRYSAAFIPTLREAPNDATTPSHILLLRAGMVRMVGAGIYEFLPLGFRVLSKIAGIVREEMNRAGAQEVMMPALLPRQYFEESGRWDSFGDTLLRLQDRKKADYHLGPTHEEIITDMVRRDVKSYRQLPMNLYQVQNKFRDEARPRAGLLRCREFVMKDAYSFDVSEEKAIESYESMREAYVKVFTRIGLEFRMVSADSGAMGGSTSAEFQVLAQNGEDAIVACSSCQYAANVEVATTPAPAKFEGDVPAIEKVATPGKKTIEDVAAFLKVPASETLKALFYRVIGDEGVSYLIAFVRGDREANEVKVLKALRDAGVSAKELVMGEGGELAPFGGVAGYMGPVGLNAAKNLTVLVDREGATGAGFVVGSNEAGFHTKNVAFGRDFSATAADVRQVGDGDACPTCGHALKSYRGIEGGHIFVLGTHYSAKMNCTFLDDKGEEKPVVMGCYGIGVSRLVATAIEQHHDADGIVWPMSIAPYQVALITAGKEPELEEAAKKLYAELTAKGVEVLFDDRDERPGVKFKDADLLGLPLRVVVGKKSIAEGKVELKRRGTKDLELILLEDAVANVVAKIEAAGVRLVPSS